MAADGYAATFAAFDDDSGWWEAWARALSALPGEIPSPGPFAYGNLAWMTWFPESYAKSAEALVAYLDAGTAELQGIAAKLTTVKDAYVAAEDYAVTEIGKLNS